MEQFLLVSALIVSHPNDILWKFHTITSRISFYSEMIVMGFLQFLIDYVTALNYLSYKSFAI